MISTAQKISHISVIIPTLNEQANIARTIKQVSRENVYEVLVVDGGSNDQTVAIAKSQGAQVLTSNPGRARQMNTGAAAAKGNILLFIHADTLLPSHYSRQIMQVLSCSDSAVAGAFKLSIDLQGVLLRIIETMANLRSCLWQMPFGDQGLFLHKSLFDDLGGFPDVPFLEDVEIIRKVKKFGKIKISQHAVQTSGRRWQELGVIRTTLLNQLIILAYLLGFSPKRLKGWYVLAKKG